MSAPRTLRLGGPGRERGKDRPIKPCSLRLVDVRLLEDRKRLTPGRMEGGASKYGVSLGRCSHSTAGVADASVVVGLGSWTANPTSWPPDVLDGLGDKEGCADEERMGPLMGQWCAGGGRNRRLIRRVDWALAASPDGFWMTWRGC
jgi:hypothetical protein